MSWICYFHTVVKHLNCNTCPLLAIVTVSKSINNSLLKYP